MAVVAYLLAQLEGGEGNPDGHRLSGEDLEVFIVEHNWDDPVAMHEQGSRLRFFAERASGVSS